jgi:hypothetical protein
LPPIWHEPCEPSDSGNSRSAASAASRSVCSTTPASTVTALDWTSISRMRFNRDSDSTISRPEPSGTCPPTSPELPPCGTIGVLDSVASRMMRLISSTLPGRSTSGVRPG